MTTPKRETAEVAIETWRPIIEGPYLVSNEGSVMHSQTGERHNPIPNEHGYLRVCLYAWDGTKKYSSIHSLVARAFIGPRPEGMTINHKDCNKTNNCPENLEYVTVGENCRHALDNGIGSLGETHPKAKLTEADIATILEMAKAKRRHLDIANHFGMNKTHIDRIISGKSWKRAKIRERARAELKE